MATMCPNLWALTKNTKQNKTNHWVTLAQTKSVTIIPGLPYTHILHDIQIKKAFWQQQGFGLQRLKSCPGFSPQKENPKSSHWKHFVTCVTCFNSSCDLHLQAPHCSSRLNIVWFVEVRLLSFLTVFIRSINSWFYWGLRYKLSCSEMNWRPRVPLTCCASLYSMRALTAVVCVRRMFFWASSIFQSHLYLEAMKTFQHLAGWGTCGPRPMFIPLWAVSSLWMNLLHSF